MRRLQLILAAVATVCLAAPVAGQTGRVVGVVLDTAGKPIKGATVRALNEDAYPPQIASTTDQKGRFAMIGLRGGIWMFVTEAPGYDPVRGAAAIRITTAGPPLKFQLHRTEPMPGALSENIQEQVTAAETLRTNGRVDDAISAYQSIQSKNPRLTAINFVIAGLYRDKAEREQDKAARRALFDRAIAAYSTLIRGDAENDRAKLQLAETQISAGNIDDATRTLQGVVDGNADSAAAAEAAAYLKQLKK